MINNKKASKEVGIGIIAMALLLLLGSMFMNTDLSISSKNGYNNGQNGNSMNNPNDYPEETYLFYLNETEIGRQNKVTESFPNIELGSKIENNVIYIGNNFKLTANPFTKTYNSFTVNFENSDNIKNFLIYFTPKRITGDQDLIIKVDGEVYYQGKALGSEIPININKKPLSNQSNIKVTFELNKPKWYQIFNWNSFEVKDLKIAEVKQNTQNNFKKYSFQVEKNFLERVELNIVVDCDDYVSNDPVTVEVNNYTIADFNPDCDKYTNRVTREIPINILNSQRNDITFKTTGFYNLGYSINKIYFNDQQTYKFTINNFNNIIDVVMYGDFDKEVMDLQINKHSVSLGRDEIKSVLQYLRFGTNEIKIITKPIDIEEFVIEKEEFDYN